MSAPVRAAGAVLWRDAGEGRVQVAVVHRPRYDDWSLPKGKLDPGEDPREAAVREVAEETGFTSRLGRALGTSSYDVVLHGALVPKTVQWWSARCLSGAFAPGPEVDDLAWLPPARAADRVTAGRDRHVLEAFAALPADTACVALVRHGRAGSRAAWDGDDARRPLDDRGRRQAARLADLLALHGPRRLLAAPLDRCRQTLQPLADRLGVPVEDEPLLSDAGRAADPEAAVDLVASLADGTVGCGQGEGLPALLAGLGARSGQQVHGASRKGAGHVLALHEGRLRALDPLDPEQRPPAR